MTSVAVGADELAVAPVATAAVTSAARTTSAARGPGRERIRFMRPPGQRVEASELIPRSAGVVAAAPDRPVQLGGPPSACSQQAAARPEETVRSGGVSAVQRSNAYGQRGWNRHAVGGRAGSGTSPGSASGSTPLPSGRGTAAISASVYG